MLRLAVECSKLGADRITIRFRLSGATPGEREDMAFRRVRNAARLRRTSHAESDSLVHSAALSSCRNCRWFAS